MSFQTFRDQYLTEAETRLTAVDVAASTTNELLAAGALYKMASSVSEAQIKDAILRMLETTTGAELDVWLANITNRQQFEDAIRDTGTMAAVAASSTAMAAVAASSKAMAAVIASSTAKMAIYNSDAALNAIAGSSAAISALRSSAQYAIYNTVSDKVVTSMTDVLGTVAGAKYIALGVSTSDSSQGTTITLNTPRSGTARAATHVTDSSSVLLTTALGAICCPITTPTQAMSTDASQQTLYVGLLRCDV